MYRRRMPRIGAENAPHLVPERRLRWNGGLMSQPHAVPAFLAIATQVLLMSFSPAWAQDAEQVTVYVAKNIITMDPGRPNATAVAVRDRHILAVGSEADMKPWTDRFPYEIDRTFADKILVPGFIAAHEHPLLAATSILRRPLVAYYPTPNPFGPDIPGVKDKAEAMGRLQGLRPREQG